MMGLRRVQAVLVVPVVAALSVAGCAEPPSPGEPLRGLSRAQQAEFEAGKAVFSRAFTPQTGLGPLFNAESCAECHEDPRVGGVGDEIEVHGTQRLPGGDCSMLAELGGPVFQSHATPALQAALGIDAEPVPPGIHTGRRTTPDLFGFGLLEAVPESEILSRADPDDANGDGISGRPNHAPDGRLGRFGRKAFVATLSEFTAAAFLIEQGVTSAGLLAENSIGGQPVPAGVDSVPEPEIDSLAVQQTAAFIRDLAPPPPRTRARMQRQGARVFAAIRCDACHVPELCTGANPVRALAYRSVHAYTDLLLHDMGPELADICLGEAAPGEFRTEPLMGLGLATQFLHDGRAHSIEDAIRAHGGEAAGSRERFLALPAQERQALLAFLAGL
jgi:CxxC motif-containing protein (DUF1111 family)